MGRALFVTAFFVVGCGHDVAFSDPANDAAVDTVVADTKPPVETITDTPDTACKAFATARCTKFGTCEPFVRDIFFDTDALCIERLSRQCLGGLSANGSNKTPADVRTCATAVEAQTCDTFQRGEPIECTPKPGKLPNAAGCYDDGQCASAFCARGLFITCGKCAPPPTEGATCVSGACPVTLACSAGVCVKPGGVGAACKATSACAQTLACRKGVCAAHAKGDACDPGAASPECSFSAGLFCDGATMQCQSLTLATIGVACAGAFSCRGASCVAGTCAPLLLDGASCSGATAACKSPLVCVSGTCALPDSKTCP